ncbi:Uncharacterized protein YR821_2008 [Yersinia ruckeri]|uniref:Uncharacterized protein n=1 Tax=Yersinia ruckeri TaxID=29486 RepID=A0A0A8VHI8_YERRU|nr:hypothetical protein yruck0001_12060 [Yersinia ruckeri ATCC 29473]QTD76929.1 Uncharacterized protein YR821_2008 [Yersinia ruckeri]CEK27823.1 hypothetical protein CSF007_10365 [Yersinia ruckeri]
MNVFSALRPFFCIKVPPHFFQWQDYLIPSGKTYAERKTVLV